MMEISVLGLEWLRVMHDLGLWWAIFLIVDR
jgi:hypothetical protein